MNKDVSIFWFRRDLRLEDNVGLFYALSENENVLPIFIFDKNILDKLEDKYDRRVHFIHQALEKIQLELTKISSTLLVFNSTPKEIFIKLLIEYKVKCVYVNHDYEPYAQQRDAEILELLKQHHVEFKTYKDQCIFEKKEVVKDDGTPYTVFTPYSNKWKKNLSYITNLTKLKNILIIFSSKVQKNCQAFRN